MTQWTYTELKGEDLLEVICPKGHVFLLSDQRKECWHEATEADVKAEWAKHRLDVVVRVDYPRCATCGEVDFTSDYGRRYPMSTAGGEEMS